MDARPPLHVNDRGDGAVLFFIHGWLNDASIWVPMIDELADTFRCVSVDLPAHGSSEPTGPGTYGRDEVLSDLVDVLAQRSIHQAIVVGHSLGGYLALALAIEHPDLVAGLGLIAAGPGFRNPASRQAWNESVDATASTRSLAAGSEQISKHVDAVVIDRLAEVEAPAVVVVGERDRRFLASADVFERHLNVRSRHVIADAGHMVHLKAAPAVAAALRASFSPR